VLEKDEAEGQPPVLSKPGQPADNSLGRLLALSDGVFAIAMTLLALDLTVPNLSGTVTSHELAHALSRNAASYWSFVLSFYIVASYWSAHRRLMRSVTTIRPVLVRDTMFLLLIVAVMPFPASLLAHYASTPFALAVYGALSAIASFTLLVLTYDVRRSDPASRAAVTPADDMSLMSGWLNLVVFLLCIPAGYILGGNGPYVLLLLLFTGPLPLLDRLARRYRLDGLWARFKPGPRV
jgi:uncharacterized membrane protein